MIKNYKFTEDELMQSIGRNLFKSGSYITESITETGRRVLSFLVIENIIYRPKGDALMPKNASITIYPQFDEFRDCYNIVITINIFTNNRNSSYDYVLLGQTKKQKQEQVKILESLLRKDTVLEIWLRGNYSKLSNWVAPVANKEIFHKDLLQKIIKWNKIDSNHCKSCGKNISKYNTDNICGDCHSKETVTNNHLK